MRWRRSIAPVLVALVLVATACGGGDDGDAQGSGGEGEGAASSEPVPGGSLTYAYHLDAESLDVLAFREFFNNTSDASRSFAIYDALLTADPETGEVQPRIATSLESEDDGATFTLALEPGVEFSDGTPYDAEAVKFNWERLQDPANSALTMQYADMMSDFEVVDPQTLRFTVTPATPQFPTIVARYLAGVGSPTAIQELGAEFGERPVGAGPFVVQEFVRGSHIALTRNETYWQEGQPYLDELRLQFIPDEQQRLQALTTGDVDVAQTADSQTIAQAETSGLAEYLWVTSAGRWLGMNANQPPFDDELAVDAIRVAIDREQYITNAEGERGIAADTVFREEHPLFDESGTFPAYDPGEAQDLLDEYADENGDPLSFTLLVPEATRSSGQAIQTLLSVYDNIDVGLDVIPTSDYLARTLAGEFEANVSASNFVDPFPTLHQQLRSDSPRNSSQVSNPDLDAALDEAAGATDDAARAAAYADVQRIIAEDTPLVMLSRPQNALLYDDEAVQNLQFFNDNAVFWDEVWVAR